MVEEIGSLPNPNDDEDEWLRNVICVGVEAWWCVWRVAGWSRGVKW